MKKVQILILALLASFAAVALTGCSQEASAPEPAPVEQPAGGEAKTGEAGTPGTAEMAPNVSGAEADANVGSRGGN